MNYELRIYEGEKLVEVQRCDNGTELSNLIDPMNRAFNGYRYEVWRDGEFRFGGVIDFPMEGNG